jgi:hypothetical protein
LRLNVIILISIKILLKGGAGLLCRCKPFTNDSEEGLCANENRVREHRKPKAPVHGFCIFNGKGKHRGPKAGISSVFNGF